MIKWLLYGFTGILGTAYAFSVNGLAGFISIEFFVVLGMLLKKLEDEK